MFNAPTSSRPACGHGAFSGQRRRAEAAGSSPVYRRWQGCPRPRVSVRTRCVGAAGGLAGTIWGGSRIPGVLPDLCRPAQRRLPRASLLRRKFACQRVLSSPQLPCRAWGPGRQRGLGTAPVLVGCSLAAWAQTGRGQAAGGVGVGVGWGAASLGFGEAPVKGPAQRAPVMEGPLLTVGLIDAQEEVAPVW